MVNKEARTKHQMKPPCYSENMTEDFTMNTYMSCKFNMDAGYVELRRADFHWLHGS
jgi:hypothetical protein